MILKTANKSVLVLLLFSICNAALIDASFEKACDSIFFANSKQIMTHVQVTNGKPVYVFAVTCKTLPFSIKRVKSILDNVNGYTFMSLITKIEHLGSEPTPQHRPVYFMEVTGNFIAKTWYLGAFDTAIVDKSSDYTVQYNHYFDPAMNMKCRDKVKALLKVEYRDFSMRWRLRKINDTTTRVELVSYLSLDIWIPQWLYKMTANMLFPGVLNDLEKYLIKIK